MPESPETADDIRTIRFDIESIKTSQHLLLRSQSGQLLADLLAEFKKDDKLALVYLALDGLRNQDEIADHITAEGVGVSQPTVSRKIQRLDAEGLIELVPAPGGAAWARKEVVEKVFRLSHKIAKQRQAGS